MRWWSEQTEEHKERVRTLVKERRLEFANGGWSMHDEACTYYEDMITNMEAGHRFLMREFGVRPRAGWHLDPFGHSSTNAALFADMGFSGWFFARLDYQDKAERLANRSMEFLWRPMWRNRGEAAEIFTHAMYDHYYPPPGFCWATGSCSYYDEPVVDDKQFKTYNVEERIDEFYRWVLHMREHYRSPNLLIPMGGDFFFKNAHKIFLNTDKLIKNFNAKYSDFKLVYSTPESYLKAVHAANVEWPVKYDDMFPYADGEHAYWTGYFTSRPNSKGLFR